VVYSETALFKDSDYKFMDKRFIMSFTEENLDKIIKYQEKQVLDPSIKKPAKCLMVMDDIQISKPSKKLNLLFQMGRHYEINMIVSLQFPKMLLSPICRSNLTYIFVKELNNEMLMMIASQIMIISGIDKKEIFNYIIDNNDEYKFVIYNNSKDVKKNERLKIVQTKLMELKVIKNKKQKTKKKKNKK